MLITQVKNGLYILTIFKINTRFPSTGFDTPCAMDIYDTSEVNASLHHSKTVFGSQVV